MARATFSRTKETVMGKQTTHSPNDDRSIVKNPNNPAYDANHGNRGGQLNPQHPNHQGEKQQRPEKK
jgi:hypothetical protein